MARFFVSAEQISGSTAVITGSDASHITRVLRKEPGDILTLCDGAGRDFECRITRAGLEKIELEILSCHNCANEPDIKISLFVALSKGDKTEYVIQKCVELGVFEIYTFTSSRCVIRLTEKDIARKTVRWRRIAYEAAKQCGRGIIPEVHETVSFKDMTGKALSCENALFFYEGETERTLKQALDTRRGDSIAVVIGPEGGFSLDEAGYAKEYGLIPVTLGKRILRCETAPVCAISAIMFHTDNL